MYLLGHISAEVLFPLLVVLQGLLELLIGNLDFHIALEVTAPTHIELPNK